jgi:CHAD domain-containing protein
MSFRFRAGESVAEGVKRLVRRETRKALDRLTGKDLASPAEVVHDARKRFKQTRAVLRLVRDELGSKVYHRENACYRDAGQPLTEVRDAAALVETVDDLAEHFGGEVPLRPFLDLREALLARQHDLQRRVLEQQDTLEQVADAVETARKRVKDWPIETDDWSALAGGLRRIYERGAQALAAARAEPADELLHEWRKRAKDLWYQFRLLQPARPRVLEKLADLAHALADDLGDDHDLAALRGLFRDEPDWFADAAAAVEAILPLLERRRAELQRSAFERGEQLYREPAATFVERLGGYWQTWRAGSEAAAVD